MIAQDELNSYTTIRDLGQILGFIIFWQRKQDVHAGETEFMLST